MVMGVALLLACGVRVDCIVVFNIARVDLTWLLQLMMAVSVLLVLMLLMLVLLCLVVSCCG